MSALPPRPEDRMLGLATKVDRIRNAILAVREVATSSPARIDLAEAACRAEALIETLTSARTCEQAETHARELRRIWVTAAPATDYGAVLTAAVHRFCGAEAA